MSFLINPYLLGSSSVPALMTWADGTQASWGNAVDIEWSGGGATTNPVPMTWADGTATLWGDGENVEWSDESDFDINSVVKTMWYSAQDSVVTQSGGKVIGISDLSGNHNDLSLSSGAINECTYSANYAAANNLPAFVFGDTTNATHFQIPASTTIQEVYFVLAYRDGVAPTFADANALLGGTGTSSNPKMNAVASTHQFQSNGNMHFDGTIAQNFNAASTTATPMKFAVYSATFTAQTTDRFYLFGAPSTVKAWRGPICEVMILPTPADMVTRVNIINYLQNKCGILFPITTVSGGFEAACINEAASSVVGGQYIDPIVNLTPHNSIAGSFVPAPGAWGIWYGKMGNVLGKSPTLVVPTQYTYFGTSSRAVYSYDTINWTVFPTGHAVASTWQWKPALPFTENEVYVAFVEVYKTNDSELWIDTNGGNPLVHEPAYAGVFGGDPYQIGTTDTGYPIYMWRISDDTQMPSGGGPKKIGVITGGTHPSEICGSWNVIGAANFLLSGDPVALRLLQDWEFLMCPQTTPESRAEATFRYTWKEDVDPNRRIPNENMAGFTGPGYEVEQVVVAIQYQYTPTGPIDFYCDYHGGIFQLYGGYLQDNEPERTDFFNAVQLFAGAGQFHDYGGYIDTTGAGWGLTVLGAKYSISAEMGTTIITTKQQMLDFGPIILKTVDYLDD